MTDTRPGPGEGSHINVGLPKDVVIDRRLKPLTRLSFCCTPLYL